MKYLLFSVLESDKIVKHDVLNIIVLKYLPYSVVLPLTAITYIWSLVIAYCFLKEKITKVKIYGIICIMIGAIFISI